MNLVLLEGALSSAPDVRTLASGSVLAQLQVTTRDNGTTRTVPVAALDPPEWVCRLDAGARLAVLGSVERRFFRAAGSTASRTEVVATKLRRGTDRRACRRLRDDIVAGLGVADDVTD